MTQWPAWMVGGRVEPCWDLVSYFMRFRFGVHHASCSRKMPLPLHPYVTSFWLICSPFESGAHSPIFFICSPWFFYVLIALFCLTPSTHLSPSSTSSVVSSTPGIDLILEKRCCFLGYLEPQIPVFNLSTLRPSLMGFLPLVPIIHVLAQHMLLAFSILTSCSLGTGWSPTFLLLGATTGF